MSSWMKKLVCLSLIPIHKVDHVVIDLLSDFSSSKSKLRSQYIQVRFTGGVRDLRDHDTITDACIVVEKALQEN